MAILRKEDVDALIREGVIQETGTGYVYAGFCWGAVDPRMGGKFAVYEYNGKFYARACLDEFGSLKVTNEIGTGTVDKPFAGREQAMRYVRETYRRMCDKLIELRNRETAKAIDAL